MKYEEIIKLLDAGYTRDDILQMEESKAPEEKQPEEQPPQAETSPETEVSEVVKEMRDLFAEMKKEFTAFNIMSSRQPAQTEKTADDIIAEIINPTKKKNGGN